MKQTIKLNTNWKNFIVKTLLSMTIMTFCFTVLSLYTPIKGLINGKSYTLIEFLSYIELKRHLVTILVLPIILSVEQLKKKTVTSTADRREKYRPFFRK